MSTPPKQKVPKMKKTKSKQRQSRKKTQRTSRDQRRFAAIRLCFRKEGEASALAESKNSIYRTKGLACHTTMLQHPTRNPDAVGLDHFKQQEDQGHHDSKHALKVLPIDAGKDEKRHDGSRTKVSNLKSLSDEDAAGMNNRSLSSASETEQNSYNRDACHSSEHDKNAANPTRFSPPTLATNLPSLCCDDKDTTKFLSWVQLMKWLPSTEDLQTGFLFDAPPVTRSNNLSQGKDNNKNRGDDGAELVENNSGLLVEGQVACQEAEEDSTQSEPATTTTPNSHTTHAQPSTLAGWATALRATSTRGRVQLAQPAANLDYDSPSPSSDSYSGLEDEESLQKLEVVKGLREWVLMQPVHLGRPVSSDNPTFYSLYLRWANLQVRALLYLCLFVFLVCPFGLAPSNLAFALLAPAKSKEEPNSRSRPFFFSFVSARCKKFPFRLEIRWAEIALIVGKQRKFLFLASSWLGGRNLCL